MRCKQEKMSLYKVPVWLNATPELPFYNLKEFPTFKDGILELPFYKEGHHLMKICLINWRYPGSRPNYKGDPAQKMMFYCGNMRTSSSEMGEFPSLPCLGCQVGMHRMDESVVTKNIGMVNRSDREKPGWIKNNMRFQGCFRGKHQKLNFN